MIQFPFSLDRLFSPNSVEQFTATYFPSKPLIIHRDQPNYYADILSCESLEEFLSTIRVTRSHLQVVDANREIAEQDYLLADGHFIDVVRLNQLFAEGATISFRNMHDWISGLSQVCRNAEQHFNCPFKANVYFSPPGAQGFRTHHDTHDVFVLQVSGSKRWRTYAPVIEAPLPGQGYYWEDGTPGQATQEFTLQAGDFFYCPRGVPHDALATSEASLHVTLGALAKTWAELVLESVADVALRDPALRASLPPQYATRGVPAAELGRIFRKLLRKVELQAQPLRILEDFADEFVFNCKPIVPQQRRDIDQASSLTVDSVVGGRPGLVYKISASQRCLRIAFHQNEIELPCAAQAAMTFALSTSTFKIGELPGELTDKAKVVLIRRLVCEGLIRVI